MFPDAQLVQQMDDDQIAYHPSMLHQRSGCCSEGNHAGQHLHFTTCMHARCVLCVFFHSALLPAYLSHIPSRLAVRMHMSVGEAVFDCRSVSCFGGCRRASGQQQYRPFGAWLQRDAPSEDGIG